MVNNQTKCVWCGASTTKTYYLKRDRRYLCLDCAKKHYAVVEKKMNRHIEEVKYGLQKKREKLQQFIYDSCDHSDFTRTGYCVGKGDKMKEICNCNVCGKQLYKEWSIR